MLYLKSDPVSLDTVRTTMTAGKEAGHARQRRKGTPPGNEAPARDEPRLAAVQKLTAS